MASRRRERQPISGLTNRNPSLHQSTAELVLLPRKQQLRPSQSRQSIHRRRQEDGKRVLATTKSAPALTKYRTTQEILSKRLIRRKKTQHLIAPGKQGVAATPVIEALIESLSRSLQQRYTGKRSLRKVFLAWDINRDGVVDPFELKEIFHKCGCSINLAQAQAVCRYFGPTDEYLIPYDGFIDLIFRDEEVAEAKEEPSMVEKLANRLRDLGVSEEEITRASEDHGVHMPLAEIVNRLKLKFQAKKSLAEEFRKIDENHDGTLSVQELHDFMCRQNIEVPKESLEELFRKFDRSSDGSIVYKEFVNIVFPERDVGAYNRLTPRSEDDSDEEKDDFDQHSNKKLHASDRDKDRRVTFVTPNVMEGLSENLASGVRSALVTARIRKAISKRLSEDFSSVAAAFDSIDVNKDGRISYGEFKAALLTLDMSFKESDADIFLRYIDQDGSGFVDYDEFKECIQGKFGANEVSGLAAASSRNVTSDADEEGMTRARQQFKNHLMASPDHEVKYLKTATVSNVGLAFSNQMPNKVEMARIQTKRKLFPAKRRAATAPASHTRSSLAGTSSDRPDFDVTSLHNALTPPRHKSRKPVEDTTYLIRPDPVTLAKVGVVGNYTYAGGERMRFQPETTRQYCLSRDSAYHRQPEQLQRKAAYETRLKKMRETMDRYNDRPLPKMQDPDLHLKTILKHRLNYFTRLEKNTVHHPI